MSQKTANDNGERWLSAQSLLQTLCHDVTDCGVTVIDLQGYIRMWSEGSRRLFGHSSESILGRHMRELYPREAVAQAVPERQLAEMAAHERFQESGWRLRKDGALFWADSVVTPIRGAHGQRQGYLQITRDLTDWRVRDQQLQASEERYRLLIDGVRDYAIFTLDPRGHVTSWNAGARFIKGYEAHEIIGSHFSRFYPPEATARHWPEHELRVASIEGRFEDEGWRLRKDGSRFWANVIITAIRDADGTLRGFSKITRDLTERRRQEEDQRRSEERFRLLLEAVHDSALFMLDARGFVDSWNFGAERILGWRAHEIIGRHFSHLYPPEDTAADKPWHDLAAAAGTRLETQGERVRKDASRFMAKIVLTPLQDAQGQLYGYAHVTQDLTQAHHLEALESIAERINEFIAILAHELRNPLAPIRNAVALMQRRGLSDPLLESMRATIDRQSGQLERIINELLDVSRVARGEISIAKERVDLGAVVATAMESSRPTIDAHRHQLHVELPPEPVLVSGDQLRLVQVVTNLLNNAAKYTASGGEIWLQLALQGNEAIVRVRDSGVGIRAEMQPRIFQLFTQDRETLSLANGGLGVGLALVRRVVELHGGRVEAHSEGRNRGSEFIVRLPALIDRADTDAAGKAAAASAPDPMAETRTLPRRRVLIADDNVDAALALSALLQTLGQETYVVHDGLAALEEAKRLRPELVLLDIGMPHLNGYEVARSLRATREGRDLLLVAVTGWGQPADRQRAHEVGFDHHLLKPADLRALRRLLEEPPRPNAAG